MASHKFNPDTLMVGMQDNGIGITYDRGSTPYQDLYGGDGMEVFFDHTDPNGIFVSIQNGNTAMSPNIKLIVRSKIRFGMNSMMRII